MAMMATKDSVEHGAVADQRKLALVLNHLSAWCRMKSERGTPKRRRKRW